MAVRFDNT